MGADHHFARQQSSGPNVRFGSKADISECPANVRFTPESGHGDFSHLRGRPAKGAGGSVVPHTLAELFPFRSVVPMLTPGGAFKKNVNR